jgi:DNA-directed RNA polymerase subunit RPC12/RpoP
MSNEVPIFKCPACNAPVAGVADYIARGLKCPSCGIGFIPVERKTRVREPARPDVPYWVWAIIAGVLAVGVGFISIWLALAVATVALLAGIFVRLGQMAKRQ